MSAEQLRRFPRLRAADAIPLADQLLHDSASLEPSTSHPNQIYAPIGGPIVEKACLSAVRDSVLGAVEEARAQHDQASKGTGVSWQTRFDVNVGIALHRSLGISRSEAAAPGVWSWLTLILLPDIVAHRYPTTTNTARVIGGLRNLFSVTWWPVEVLGDLVEPESGLALQVDEIVGLFERSTLSRDRDLAVAYAETVRSDSATNRMFTTREFAKAVRRVAAHTSWTVSDKERLGELWDEARARASTTPLPETMDHEGLLDEAPINVSVRLGALDLPIEIERTERDLQPTGHLPWTALSCPATSDPPQAVVVEGHRVELTPDGVTRKGRHARYVGEGRLPTGVTVRTTVIRRTRDIFMECRLT